MLGSALAWLLARKHFPGRNLIDALITLPLVLPPTVLGYYLLVMLGTRSAFGGFLYNRLGIRLTFRSPRPSLLRRFTLYRW